jgi:hypothetical protein
LPYHGRMRGSAVVVLLVSACGTYKVQRAALVPHQQPLLRSGQPGEGRGEIALGASAISLGDPEVAPGANAGLYIPSVEVNAAVRLRPTPNLDIGLMWDHGLRKGADAIQPGQPPLEHGDVMGAGLSVFYSAPTPNPALRIGVGTDLIFYSVPWIEYTACVSNCGLEPWLITDEEREMVPVLAVGVIPSYRLSSQLALFGGLTVRNHPTIKRTEYQNGTEVLFEDDAPEAGPANFIASAGLEAQLGGGFRLAAILYQPIQSEPARYPPSLGFTMTIPLGRPPAPAPAGTVPAPYPPAAPPYPPSAPPASPPPGNPY